MKKITIVGGGLCGSLMAVLMARRGLTVELFERRPDPRKNLIDGGRSINLVVSHRGWTALKAAGIEEEIREITVPVYQRMMHDREGNTIEQSYSADRKAIHSVSRGGLNEELLSQAEAFPNVNVHFEHRCQQVDLDSATCIFIGPDGSAKSVVADLVIGADGAFSAVRRRLLGTRLNFSQQYVDHDYKELLIPPAEDGTPRIDPQSLHIWPRGSFMLMALANLDGGFTGTAFWPREGENSFAAVDNEIGVIPFFEKEFADVIPLVPDLEQQYAENPTSSLMTVRCDPWHYRDKVMLIGDAAHAIVPFYGEGMNCGLEDCRVFNDLLDDHGHDNMATVLDAYSSARVKNGHAIADLSLRNFVEMRDSVGDPEFLLRKKIEGQLYLNHPDKWLPLYSQVKFSNIEYADALREGKRHDAVMEQVLRVKGIEENWNSEEVQNQALRLLETVQ
jgi:kynurenine 3-monooxygenase